MAPKITPTTAARRGSARPLRQGLRPDTCVDRRSPDAAGKDDENCGRESVARSETGHNENGLKPITGAALDGLQLSHPGIHIPARRFGSPHCTPGTGVNLWGASPLYISEVELRSIFECDQCNKSTRRRQLRGGNNPWRGSLRMCREADNS